VAGLAPAPGDGLLWADRRVSCRGNITIARQKIQVGIGHATAPSPSRTPNTTFRVYHGERLLTEVVHATTKTIAR
jgi:hypothetical protein